MKHKGLTGIEYLRVSKDKSKVERSPDEQHADHVRVLPDEGITLSDRPAYRDVKRASRTSKEKRPDFAQLMADLYGDAFPEDVLVMWEASRGSRRVGEWATLLDLLEDRSKLVYVFTHDRILDPKNPRDRKTLLDDAVDAEYESGKIGQRTGRSMLSNAEDGARHGGRRAFGYANTGTETVPAEAEIVRECARRVLAGESTRSIAADLNRRGITTSAGNAWHPGPLRNLLAGTRIAGIRTHRGRVVAKGTWDAIITEDEHRRLVATLDNRSPIGRRGRTPWLLTGFLRCGLCGASLAGNSDAATGTRRYICRKAPGYHGCGGLGIKAEPLEEMLGLLVAERLHDIDARRNAGPGEDDDSAELAEISSLAAKRITLADAWAEGRISDAQRTEDAAALDRRQRVVEAALAAKVRTVAPLDFIAAEGFVGRPWASLDVEEQRVVLTALVDHVTVAPASLRGSTKFEAARVTAPGRIVWKI